MKPIYFLFIVIAIYYIITKINVVHVNTLPFKQKKELRKRSKFRSMIVDNHVRCDNENESTKPAEEPVTFKENELLKYTDIYSASGKNTRDYKHDYFDFLSEPIELPGANDLYILLRSEYIDTEYIRNKYRFNITNQPVTSRYPNKYTISQDKKYLSKIKKDIRSWNNIFRKYYHTDKKLIDILDIKLIFITETDFEFVIQGMIKLSYKNKTMHFRINYYGQINKTDDFLNGGTNTYMLQLYNLQPISKSEFDSKIDAVNLEERTPFMSMEDQMTYVDKINKTHQNKTDM